MPFSIRSGITVQPVDALFSATSAVCVTGLLTVEKVYRSLEGKVAYGIIAASGEGRERRAYLLDEQGETVIAETGRCTLELPVNDMFELLAMALQAEDARKTIGEHMIVRQAVNED